MFKDKLECCKEWFWFLINSFLIVLVVVGIFSVKALSRYEDSVSPTRTISVAGEGKVTAIPDIAEVSFSVVSEGKDPKVIASDNAKKVNSAIDFVKGQGIDAKDVKTTQYSLYPRYEYDEDKKTTFISGYTLTQTVLVKIRDFSKISTILGMLPEIGINQIGALSFSVDDDEKYLSEARREAFENAFVKAKEMAKQNNVRIKKVITFSESGNAYPMYKTSGFGMAEDSISAPRAPQIEPGSQEMTLNVSVVYEIR